MPPLDEEEDTSQAASEAEAPVTDVTRTRRVPMGLKNAQESIHLLDISEAYDSGMDDAPNNTSIHISPKVIAYSTPPMHTATKRRDLQGLRGVAIIAVLLFHLIPKSFPNGFLGVDIFFVLSGYLMGRIFAKESEVTLKVMKTFYIRRIKRIVPVYALVLLFLSIITPIIFAPSDIGLFTTDLSWALALGTNVQNMLKEVDYWTEIFNYPVVLHAWSLGVEMQFYLAVPFIMHASKTFTSSQSKALFLAALASGSHYVFIASNPKISFNFMLARVWQFMVGCLAVEMEAIFDVRKQCVSSISTQPFEEVEVKPGSGGCLHLVLFILLLVQMLIPFALNQAILRLVATSLAGLVILTAARNGSTSLLTNRLIVYMGDISYIVYLVHWPVIILYKYHAEIKELNLLQAVGIAVVTLLISVVIHHTLEDCFIRGPALRAVIFIAIAYSIIFIVICFGVMASISDATHQTDSNIDKAALVYNQRELKKVYFKLPDALKPDTQGESWTKFKAEGPLRAYATGNGTASVMVLGNSFGYRAVPHIFNLFQGRFREFRLYTRSSCTILGDVIEGCVDFDAAWRTVVEKQKPDIIFIIESRHRDVRKPVVGDVRNDSIVKRAQANMDYISNHTKVLSMDYLYLVPNVTESIAHKLIMRINNNNHNFDDLKTNYEDYLTRHKWDIMRTDALWAPNIVRNRVQEQLCSELKGTCFFYHRKNLFSYYSDTGGHLTTEGEALLEAGYKNIIENFLSNRTVFAEKLATSTS